MKRVPRKLLLTVAILAGAAFSPAREAEPEVAWPAVTGRWWRVSLHAHAASAEVADDGGDSVAELHEAAARAGFALSLHTPHSSMNGQAGPEAWQRQRQREQGLAGPGRVTALGQELSVANGPRYRASFGWRGLSLPGNGNHLTLVGITAALPDRTGVADACAKAHGMGGACLVSHPGPGPLMWEEGLWEVAARAGVVDALEVYNGEALGALGIDFERVYLEAISTAGLGARLAAVGAADTHGSGAGGDELAEVLGFFGAGAVASGPGALARFGALRAGTLVLSRSPAVADVVAGLRARRTIAVFGFSGLEPRVDGLGEERVGSNVLLRIDAGRTVAEIVLYEDGHVRRRWQAVQAVSERIAIDRPHTFAFGLRDGDDRALTSGIWCRPAPVVSAR